jgi:D-glycero-D-manno-heptose 1,7-bisphosphate phosphatase
VRNAVFFDRDGVLNEALVRDGRPFPPRELVELTIVLGAAHSLEELRERGFALIAITNQPDVARGTQRKEIVEAINARLRIALPLDDLLVCYHDDRDNCECRKPKPGLLFEAAKKHEIDLQSSYLVGDRWRDIEAGSRAGCKTVWIDRSYDEPKPTNHDARVTSLDAACAWIATDGERR